MAPKVAPNGTVANSHLQSVVLQGRHAIATDASPWLWVRHLVFSRNATTGGLSDHLQRENVFQWELESLHCKKSPDMCFVKIRGGMLAAHHDRMTFASPAVASRLSRCLRSVPRTGVRGCNLSSLRDWKTRMSGSNEWMAPTVGP